MKRLSGVLNHPTSFPSKYGIGDLGKEAMDFIDFLDISDMSLWQILPLNPTGYGDSPYQSFSVFAGNPLLISIDILMDKGLLDKKDIIEEDFPLFIDYGKVIDYKERLFKIAFNNYKKNKIKKEEKIFREKNIFWLHDYALFISIKKYYIKNRKVLVNIKEYKDFYNKNKDYMDKNQINDNFYGGSFISWDMDLINREKNKIKEMEEILKDEIEYEKFLQYEFFTQWNNIKEYANKKGIKIIGDLPIFVSFDSADLWANPDLFLLDKDKRPKYIAGVPPDYFSETGQLWGNPLYNWGKHKEENYNWWINRIKLSLETMDIIRIDHFRGFVDYWEVPYGEKTAINGKWIKGPREDFFKEIEKKLGKLPIIAEDLGIITKDVKKLREELDYPGMKVLQFAFDSPENEYLPHNYDSKNTVVYTGTHDNDTTKGWYKGLKEKEKDFIRRYMNIPGENISWDLIRLVFSSIANYVIIPIQDILNLDSQYRMNSPGIGENNWEFRYNSDMLNEDISENLRYLNKLFNRKGYKNEKNQCNEITRFREDRI